MDREYMGKVNSYGQKKKYTVVYDLVAKTGPPHDPEFTVVLIVKGEEYGRGTGKSIKAAKEVAAKKAWERIEEEEKSSSNMAAADLTTAQTTSTTSSPAPDKNYVCLLNSISQRTGDTVGYTTENRTGDPHAPTYSVSCTIRGQLYGKGTGPSIAAAKKAAAKEAYEKWELERANNSNSSQVSAESDSDNNTICFADSSAKLEEKMKDMAICEKPSPSQRNAQRSVLETKRKLAANFANVRNKEEEKNMSDSSEGLPDVDTNTGKENGSPHTVNKTFLQLFEKIQHIGAGGFGNVFKATSKCDKTTYAIKRVEFTEKVEREARGLARLSHENIVRYHCSWRGYDRIEGSGSRWNSDPEILCLFIQMEFCEQGTLQDWVIKNSEDRKYHEMAQDKFLQIAKGVQCIHSEELIHRDLKPQNIFISHDNKIKIGDFGLVTSVAFETLTENRGTRSYMAPEQIGTKYGKEVDIYALGLIWFEILSAITAHEKSEVWSSIRAGELPEYFKNQFPAEASIIKKMLSTDPSGRITISHLLDLLNSVDKEKALRNYSY
ncbi:interferon-induced, double-stranded RNA-activated protein kinase [Ammospiza nelsoni]|uniref:interferon-induced, double-stranded RNA-activated protein kinase n=1 Tax=Ammospiza caudacuta TaxID=2857398 RepID=UPI002738C4B9|nr:interferon-induced, double-stranded RNA-activated protein kinase [Ammospiza caudacuta]XP_059323258.1 interferon-induced, double-stranded RNA-activated protein kinase [Ammospiza nelsoni]